MISNYGNSVVVQIATLFEQVYHVTRQRVLWNGTFCTYILPRFPECVISKINQLWGSSFFWKCSKFKVDFENLRKNPEKAFCFWDNYGKRILDFWLKQTFSDSIENLRKNPEKAFCFWDNCVRIGCVKLSLLRKEYLSSAVNVLKKSYKALPLTKTDFFWHKYLPDDQ